MLRRATWACVLLCLLLVLATAPPASATTTPPAPTAPVAAKLTLTDALSLAEANNAALRQAYYAVTAARGALTAAPANAAALAPAASLYLRMQYGIEIPEQAISPTAARQQAQITYEQAALQYYQARRQVRMGVCQAYAEWQRGTALVVAQESALKRAESQRDQVRVALEQGAVARLDLLQAEAMVAGQQATLAGARALEASARAALAQAIGRPIADGVVPGEPLVRSQEVKLTATVAELMARALTNRPDLIDAKLSLAARRLQAGLATGGPSAAMLQLEGSAASYEAAVAKAEAEVRQALWAAQAGLSELKAREAALDPAREALRLAELRYQEGLTTYTEVQAASAQLLQTEAAQIESAAKLTQSLYRLAQATGDL
ncbi:MAG: TolC family protein [Mycobacterium leprae]